MAQPDPVDFKALFEGAPGCSLVLSPELQILAVSDGYLAATMTQRGQILGRGLFEVFPDNPDDPAADGTRNLKASLNRLKRSLKPDEMQVQKYDIRRPDGSFEERHWKPVNHPVLGPDGELRCIIHHVEDVTEFVKAKQEGVEQKRISHDLRRSLDQAETQRQSQRLEALGLLAGGVAHDFNNLVTVISGYAHLLQEGLPAGSPLQEGLAQIDAAGRRATSLTRQLLAFSRKQVLQPEILDVNQVMEGMGRMLRRVIGENIELLVLPQQGLDPVLFDPGQLEQIILNLAINARDAMPQGGRLTLETANVDLDQAYVEQHPEAVPGRHVLLAVTDTGHGMDPAVQARIFEPFYTTKKDMGTGLGLATVHGIVRQSGGNIWVYSEPGHGACFKVYLPSASGIPSVHAAPPSPSGPAPGSGNILLVEDEEGVRKLLQRVLETGGYEVQAYHDAEGALSFLRDLSQPVDLLLTDVILPGMNGRQLGEEAQRLRPGLKVAHMSGYTDNVMLNQGLLEPGTNFIEKPVAPGVLLEKIRGYLAQ